MAEKKWSELYRSKLSENTDQPQLTEEKLGKTNDELDQEATKIYAQAREHRGRLVTFYTNYTACTTIIILWLVIAQGLVRIMTADKNFEIMPQWTMNIIVGGMFGQFVGLLQIVTKSVWNLKSFFDHHYEMHKNKDDISGEL